MNNSLEDRKLKLCFLASESVHTSNWISDFVERGHDVHLITFGKIGFLRGVKVHNLKYHSKPAYPLRIIDVRNAVRSVKPDILHAFYVSHYGVYGLSGFHPFIMTVLGGDVLIAPERANPLFRLSVQLALMRADLVHVSDNAGQKTLAELGCNPKKIIVQEWGVDVDRFSSKAKSEALREKLAINGCYSVLSASSWRVEYSVDVLIRAAPLVLKEIPNVKFILLGGGPLETYLKTLAKKLGVYESIHFAGKIPYEEMPEYLASVDVFIDTVSDYAYASGRLIKKKAGMGIGQTAKEAMACGTPQILPDHSSINYDLFKGLTYKQLNHADLAEKIIQLLQDKALRIKIAEESRASILEKCDKRKIAGEWNRIYQALKQKKDRAQISF